MSPTHQLLQNLDAISKDLWKLSLNKAVFESLKEKISTLSAQIAVHHVLDNLTSQLLDEQSGSTLLIQNRLSKFIEVLYGTSDNANLTTKPRWEELRSLDCESFLFVAASYTPLEISKMHRVEFQYLIVHIPEYLRTKNLPRRWMFRREVQMALAEKAELEYHILEFGDDDRSRKRPRLDSLAVDAQAVDAQAVDANIRHESTESESLVPSKRPPENGPASSQSKYECELRTNTKLVFKRNHPSQL
ncbi:hypothetical protein GQ43DRAFT_436395 [Delitschia confertaspora ATCC 74209]|uniref:Uncharacterized protein n=1 Tax=Delitschia confertaspora ATCC 74209 TaxID=1513339 RepID=A0A9P4JGB0_9PLEO|nr:hypothetical protein GQ43DRAFT_436395 [Delitschia confertaspora ATCC 74209]